MMKSVVVFILTILLLLCSSIIIAQECGPNCPICSGSGSNTESLLAKGVWLGNALMVPGGEDTFIPTFKTAIHDRIDIGFGYLNKSREAIWSVRVLLFPERERSPGLIAGSGSVRMGGSDQSVFITATKNFEDNIQIPIRLSLGTASVLPDMDIYYFIGTASYLYKEKLFPFITYDGINTHYGVSYILLEKINIGLLYLENERFGLSAGIRFEL